MHSLKTLRLLGQGALILNATAIVPIWSELTFQTDSSYPTARNILLIIVFVSFPSIICVFLSNDLYRQKHSTASWIGCFLSLAMLTGTLLLFRALDRAGEKGIPLILLIPLQSLTGMVLFGVLRRHYRKSCATNPT
jgi:hypothetical protein